MIDDCPSGSAPRQLHLAHKAQRMSLRHAQLVQHRQELRHAACNRRRRAAVAAARPAAAGAEPAAGVASTGR
eukprot:78823-Chlamydomonas_euryale.AAC.1